MTKKTKEKLTLDIQKLSIKVLSYLKKNREKDILSLRFGLSASKKQTLSTIGKKYKITRERVRQIEAGAIKKLQKVQFKELIDFWNIIEKNIDNKERLMSEEKLFDNLDVSDNVQKNTLNFLILINKNLNYIPENKLKASWTNIPKGHSFINSVVSEFISILKSKKEIMPLSNLLAEFKKSNFYKENKRKLLSDKFLVSCLDISKKIAEVKSGWGLKQWREVTPKTIRDRIYVILKNKKKPIHFSIITKLVIESGKRKVTTQAIHNELIKDERFVLIGRGIYALDSWGYKHGTVADIIERILKKENPLHKNEIVKEVLKRRKVKETTIVLNLQNKNKFKRVAKATYILAK